MSGALCSSGSNLETIAAFLHDAKDVDRLLLSLRMKSALLALKNSGLCVHSRRSRWAKRKEGFNSFAAALKKLAHY